MFIIKLFAVIGVWCLSLWVSYLIASHSDAEAKARRNVHSNKMRKTSRSDPNKQSESGKDERDVAEPT